MHAKVHQRALKCPLVFLFQHMISNSSLPLFKMLWGHIRPNRKRQLFALVFLMIMTSLVELISISALFPFLRVITNPEGILNMPLASSVKIFFSISTPEEFLYPLTLIFVALTVLTALMRLLLLWATTRLSFSIGADISMDVYFRTLNQPYSVHISRNSSEVIDGIATKANSVIFGAILPTLFLISSAILLMVILTGMLSFEPIASLAMLLLFSVFYYAIMALTRKQLQANGIRIASESTNVIRVLQEGLGGIRDVIIDRSQKEYCSLYRLSDSQLRSAQASNIFIGQSPRYIMEALGIISISYLAYYLSRQPGEINSIIPILGVLALGAQRLLPVLQQAFSSWSSILANSAILKDILALLDQPLRNMTQTTLVNKINFTNEIRFRQTSFRYSIDEPFVLRNLNFTIYKGDRIGIIGKSGSGKSTLLDILMGLLEPTNGALEVDGHLITSINVDFWQKHIAHVPQQIFLSDSTIEQNIALGVPLELIDLDKVKICAKKAQIAEYIETMPNKYKTSVGEGGIRLSGGQRQRIGIARALYKNVDLIIFDEATSALDSVTEKEIMKTLYELGENLTIVIVAHRLTTLKNCTKIVEISNGSIASISSYEELKI
jgi:ABC-type multidrug transport system fused ATPase/permease subunit